MNSSSNGKRILVVDNELSFALTLCRALEHPLSGGHQVELNLSANTVLTRLECERFDLIVISLCAPGAMSGPEFIRRVNRISPQTRTIMLTNTFDSPEIETQDRRLASAYLTKPISLMEFVSTVQEVLSRNGQ